MFDKYYRKSKKIKLNKQASKVYSFFNILPPKLIYSLYLHCMLANKFISCIIKCRLLATKLYLYMF